MGVQKKSVVLMTLCVVLVVLHCNKTEKIVSLAPTVKEIVGEAVLEKADGSKRILKPSMQLSEGDIVNVFHESKIRLSVGAKNDIFVLGSCKFKVDLYDIDTSSNFFLNLSLPFGEMFSSFQKLTGNNRFSVRTPTAVASIRGTNFSVSYNRHTKRSDIKVLGGTVAVDHPETGAHILVPAGEKIWAKPEKIPEKPETLRYDDVKHLTRWVGKTKITKTVKQSKITVAKPVNRAPQWYGTLRKKAYVGVEFIDTLRAEDPENGPVTFHLLKGATGMTLDSLSGELRFAPQKEGQVSVAAQACDMTRNCTPQKYTISVLGGLQAVLIAPKRAYPGLPVILDAGRSVSHEGNFSGLRYRFDIDNDGTWDYPKEGFDTTSIIRHIYNEEGTFVVTLEVTDRQGTVSEAIHEIIVGAANDAPRARLRVYPSVGSVNQKISLDATLSSDSRDPADSLKVRWDLDGDEVWDFPTGDQYSHDKSMFNIWDSAGMYNVCVEVIDLEGAVSKTCAVVDIREGMTIENLRGPDTVGVGQKVKYECVVVAALSEIATYEWDTDGDGTYETRSDSAGCILKMTKCGPIDLRCRVTDKNGMSAEKSRLVYVDCGPVQIDAGGPYSVSIHTRFSFAVAEGKPDPRIVRYLWDFDGNGSFDWESKEMKTAEYSFKKAGEYKAVFAVVTNENDTIRDSAEVRVTNFAPKAFAGDDILSKKNKEVLLKGTGSDKDGKIERYDWDFDGDGGWDWSSAKTGHTMHKFEKFSTAILQVTSSDRGQARDTVRIVICPDDMRTIKNKKFCIDRYEYPNKKGLKPKVNVTYSEAREFCQKEEKRLCTQGEWVEACKKKENHQYPYGRKSVWDNCNHLGNGYVRNSLARAGYFEKCRSDEGVYDMSGNAAEWVKKDGNNSSVVMGGSYQQNIQRTSCQSKIPLNKNKKYFYVGFRCCK